MTIDTLLLTSSLMPEPCSPRLGWMHQVKCRWRRMWVLYRHPAMQKVINAKRSCSVTTVGLKHAKRIAAFDEILFHGCERYS